MFPFIARAIALLIALANSPVQVGYASRYDPGIMEATAAYHGYDMSQYDGAVAALSCDWLGQEWLVRPYGSQQWRRVIVADCAGDGQTYEWMASNSILVELDYNLGIAFGAVSGGVRVEVVQP